MLTPAKKHWQRVTAMQEAQRASEGDQPTMANATGYELVLAKLIEDRRRLKEIQSIERKIEVKKTLLPEYAAYVDGALVGGSGAQDDVLMTVMIWRIDTGDIAGALPIAKYAVQHKLTLPDQYERSLGTLIAEEVAETALAAIAAGETVAADLIGDYVDLTADSDMPDEVRAKLCKALGYALRTEGTIETLSAAASILQRALQLAPKIGVKKDIEKLQRDIKQLTATAQQQQQQSESSASATTQEATEQKPD